MILNPKNNNIFFARTCASVTMYLPPMFTHFLPCLLYTYYW